MLRRQGTVPTWCELKMYNQCSWAGAWPRTTASRCTWMGAPVSAERLLPPSWAAAGMLRDASASRNQYRQRRFFPSYSCQGRAEQDPDATTTMCQHAWTSSIMQPHEQSSSMQKQCLFSKHCSINCLNLILNSLLLLSAAFSNLLARRIFGVLIVWGFLIVFWGGFRGFLFYFFFLMKNIFKLQIPTTPRSFPSLLCPMHYSPFAHIPFLTQPALRGQQ